jgi:4-amino-4-deoxy-L-arabinose transferase-like glycosyltransferase
MFVGLAAAGVSAVDRSARWLKRLRPLPGILLMLVMVLPWFAAIYLRTGSSFLVNAVGHDMLAKVGGGQEAHGAPPGYYLLLFFLTFFPGSALAFAAIPATWARRRDRTTGFLLAWLVPSWIVLELVPTKLPHYVLPLYPAIAILVAGAIESNLLSKRRSLTGAAMWWFVLPSILALLAVGGAAVIGHDLRLRAWPFLAVAIVCGLFAWRLYGDDGPERALLRGMAASILLAIGIYAVILPGLSPVFPSVALANVLKSAGCTDPVAASSGYEEPSLVFLAGTPTRLTDDPAFAADFLHEGGCRFAFIEAAQERAFTIRASAIGLHYKAGLRINGFNISNGRRVAISVFQSASGQ